MTDTIAHARAASPRAAVPIYLLGLGLLLALAMSLLQVVDEPRRAALTVRNGTAWDISVRVREDDGDTPVVTVSAEHQTTAGEVRVPGSTWHLVWRFKGEDVATSSVRDADVRRDDFVIDVPDEVARALRERGEPPAP
jgi:hypothetical protein